jgi:hypothetical protein
MAYSRWADSYWYTSALTGAPHINESVLFINPRKGQGRQFLFSQLEHQTLDTQWVSKHFPDAPMHHLSPLLFFIHAFIDDMRSNVYRYHGFKEPVPLKADSDGFPLLNQRVADNA